MDLLRVALLVVAVLASAGCGQPPANGPETPTPTPGNGGAFIEAPVGDVEPPYDLWNVTLINLNGSLAVHVVIDNVTPGTPHPFYNVTLQVDRHEGGSVDLFVALRFDPTRAPAPPNTYPAAGGQFPDGPEEWATCLAAESGSPAHLFQDLEHERTGLKGGGVVTHVAVAVMDKDGTVHDQAAADGAYAIAGGANPYVPPDAEGDDRYNHCPLFEDPSSPQYRGPR